MSDLVSVIIPSYGRQNGLKRALNSIDNQKYKNINVYLVITPRDGEYVSVNNKKYDVEIEIIRTEEGITASEARNIGLKRAEGDLIAFLDDDDEWLPKRVSTAVKKLKNADENTMATVCGNAKIVEGEIRTQFIIPETGNWVRYALTGSIGTFSTILIDSEIISKVGLLDESLELFEDKDYTLRLAQETNFTSIQDVLVYKHRDSEKHLGSNYAKMSRDAEKIRDKYRDLAKSYEQEDQFLGSLEMALGRTARAQGKYLDAIGHMKNATLLDFRRSRLMNLLATLGGPISYKLARRLHRFFNDTYSVLPNRHEQQN